MLAPYTIASGVNANQNSYAWNVGTVNSNCAGVCTNGSGPADGQYTIQICQSGTSSCDSSDGTFTVTSSQTSNLPDINIVSPNGGEVWAQGATQSFMVSVSGNPSTAGNAVNAYLANLSGQQYFLGTNYIPTYPTIGQKSFNVAVPPTIPAGSYRLYATLYSGSQFQAYDYSDNYFTVQGAQSYPYLYNCPAGYTCTPNSTSVGYSY